MEKGGSPKGPPNMPGDVFERNHPVSLLDGDYDVFGDGSVVIKAAYGHTPGHQVLYLKLPRTGPVLLAGSEMIRLLRNPAWEIRFDHQACNCVPRAGGAAR